MKSIPIMQWQQPESFAEALFGVGHQADKIIKEGNTESHFYQLPKHIGEGHVEIIIIDENLTVAILNITLINSFTYKIVNEQRKIFSFTLEHENLVNFEPTFDVDDSTPVWRLINSTETFLQQEIPANTRFSFISLGVVKGYFNKHFQGLNSKAYKKIKHLLINNKQQFIKQYPLGQELSLIANQLLVINIHDSLRLNYIIAKISELFCLSLNKIFNRSLVAQNAPVAFKQSDKKAVKQAYDIVLSDLTNVPPLSKICLLVGINRNKLHYGFKQMFNMSLAQLIKEERLSKSRRLLVETDKAIIDIALESGYNHQSSFSSSFKKRYGISPINIRKK